MGRTWKQNGKVTCQQLSQGVRHDAIIMLYGMPGAFFFFSFLKNLFYFLMRLLSFDARYPQVH